MITIDLNEIERESKNALLAHGAADWVATEVAKAVRKAEATGNRICGLYYLESYCKQLVSCLLYTSPSPRDLSTSRMPSSA